MTASELVELRAGHLAADIAPWIGGSLGIPDHPRAGRERRRHDPVRGVATLIARRGRAT